jgi:hypothetical protein
MHLIDQPRIEAGDDYIGKLSLAMIAVATAPSTIASYGTMVRSDPVGDRTAEL